LRQRRSATTAVRVTRSSHAQRCRSERASFLKIESPPRSRHV
jgi:hypothetical protein